MNTVNAENIEAVITALEETFEVTEKRGRYYLKYDKAEVGYFELGWDGRDNAEITRRAGTASEIVRKALATASAATAAAATRIAKDSVFGREISPEVAQGALEVAIRNLRETAAMYRDRSQEWYEDQRENHLARADELDAAANRLETFTH